jgi:hypothetical protein
MRRFGRLIAAAGAAVAMVGLSAGSAAASPLAPAVPAFPHYISPIASGYAAVPETNGAKAFEHVQVSFTVPIVICPGSPKGAIAQQRAGLDGISDDTIERVGVSESCQTGTEPYTAWYQMYPAKAHVLFDPSPGDKVSLSVTLTPGGYTFVVDDVTTAKTYTAVATCATVCHNSSAQVTAGSPAPVKPADFGTVHFSDIVITDTAGVSGGLANPSWGTLKLIQPGHPHTVAGPLTTASAPPPPHSSFADQWKP